MSHQFDIIITGALLMVAYVSPSSETQTYILATIGAIGGGLTGAVYFPADTKNSIRTRWGINVLTGGVFGPSLAWWFFQGHTEYPMGAVALASGGVVGMLGVLLLTIILPWTIKWLLPMVGRWFVSRFKMFLGIPSKQDPDDPKT